MKSVLVTGAAGYIASHTILELLEEGYDVIGLDNFVNAVETRDGKAESLTRVERLTGKTTTFYKVDIRDETKLGEIFDKHKIDCVLHFAGLKAVGESVQVPLDYYYNNVQGALSLLQVMRDKKVKNFIFSSSATVYGAPQRLPISEHHPTGQGITNPYGRTKYFIEEIVKDLFNAEKNWNVFLLRYFNPVGAHKSGRIGEDPKGIPNNLMPYVSQVCVGKLPHVRVYGNDYDTADGTGVRDYIHVVDLAKGHVAALKKLEMSPTAACRTYNLGTGRGYSVLEMISAMEKASGKTVNYKIEGRRDGDCATVYCDPKFAYEDLGWKAQLTLDDMCQDLWRWQSQNPNGFVPN